MRSKDFLKELNILIFKMKDNKIYKYFPENPPLKVECVFNYRTS